MWIKRTDTTDEKETNMPAQALFGLGVAFGFIAWGIVAAQYCWPPLRTQARGDALRPLLLHSFRFIGLAFLVKCVVAPELPAAFAVPAAYGDLIAALLALVALVALRRAGFGIPLVWAFNLWATAEDESLKLKSPPLPGVASGTFIQPRPE